LQQSIGLTLIALGGWEASVDAGVTVVDIGATGSLDTTTAQSPVIGLNFGEEGLMAGVSVKGTKVTKLDF
jgi:lipid-binding SYLF domain-containing protein